MYSFEIPWDSGVREDFLLSEHLNSGHIGDTIPSRLCGSSYDCAKMLWSSVSEPRETGKWYNLLFKFLEGSIWEFANVKIIKKQHPEVYVKQGVLLLLLVCSEVKKVILGFFIS